MSRREELSFGSSEQAVRETYFAAAVEVLRASGMTFGPGLSEGELAEIEQSLDLRIPPDLSDLLSLSIPIGDDFPDWRGPRVRLDKIMSWPTEGICFDVERNGFWLGVWGPRPIDLENALATAREAVSVAPKLAPIYKHRYLPSEPQSAGNPVLSVYQTDVICYGVDLPGYLNR